MVWLETYASQMHKDLDWIQAFTKLLMTPNGNGHAEELHPTQAMGAITHMTTQATTPAMAAIAHMTTQATTLAMEAIAHMAHLTHLPPQVCTPTALTACITLHSNITFAIPAIIEAVCVVWITTRSNTASRFNDLIKNT